MIAAQERPAVSARGLTKRYGDVIAVRSIDFAIAARECFGFLGVNGAGKTTTMKMIYCRTGRTSGLLDVLGMDTATHAADIKRRIGVVTQDNALDPELTTYENILVYASFFDISAKSARHKADRLLELLSLQGKGAARLQELSGGMKRRLVIARALVNDPELLVLDEPTTGLDPQARLLVWETLLRLRRSGITVVLTSHYMEEAARLCDRIMIMDQGAVHAEGTPRALIERFAAPDVLEIHATDSRAVESAALDGLVRRREQHGDTVYLYNADNRLLLQRLTRAGVELRSHVARAATLEDVFLNITGRELSDA